MRNHAGFWLRFFAFIIDAIVLSIFNWILLFLIGEGGLYQLIAGLVGWFYFAGLESSSRQGTWGKQALKLKVTDASGNQVSFARATGRYFAKILSSLILLIGYLMIAFTEQKQGLHDKLASTFVVKG